MASAKFVFALWGARDPLGPALTEACRAAGARGLQVNVADAAVASAMLRLSTFDRPIDAVVCLLLPDDGDRDAMIAAVRASADRCEGWLVEERVPLEPPATEPGERTPGLANIAFLRRPADQHYDEWLECWQVRHTRVAIETQATVGYVQNRVIERVTPDDGGGAGVGEVAAIVEEQFPIDALADPHAFYGTGGDTAELTERVARMMASVATFGAARDLDVVPTSRHRRF
ncbi:hypothetical protein OG225_00530 [Nocardia sp. NBC_01377]|uniref:hypothetical protein n=1 Tax=Nocardia sp. NBC_01377 TaxID=2903595 RepID=UPI0032516032